MKWRIPQKSISIQLMIIRQNLLIAASTIASVIIAILFISGIITLITPWRNRVEHLLGFSFYSITYFNILIVILIIGTISAVFFTFYFGYPLGNVLKKKLQSITDGSEAFSRGKLDHRIKIEGYDEIDRLGQQFNKMAEQIQRQVISLQRLAEENAALIEQTKYSAALDERRKIARDLHDAVSQQLFAISMTLSALPRLLDTDREEAKKYFYQIEEMVLNAQQELRALILHLRPVTLEGHSLQEGLAQLLNELAQKHMQINWEWEIDKEINLSKGIEDNLFRIIQESISNVLRHANATQFRLRLKYKQNRIILMIEDNGVGFKVTERKKSSYGLNSINERVTEIGGRIDLISYPGKGTRIEVRVPINVNKELEVNGEKN